jgi:putative membrane protein
MLHRQRSFTIAYKEYLMLLSTCSASLHHIAAFTLVACLVYEWLTFRQTLTTHEARGLQRIDLWYGVSAVMLLVAGVLRVIYGGKGYQFYMGSTLFWVKMVLVLIISILSIYPTIRYIRWGTIADAGMVVPDCRVFADPQPVAHAAHRRTVGVAGSTGHGPWGWLVTRSLCYDTALPAKEYDMHIALWIIQGLCAGMFIMAGFMKAFKYDTFKTQAAWTADYSVTFYQSATESSKSSVPSG